MKIILLTVLLGTSLISSSLWAQEKIEEIEQYEIRSYDPQKSGLKDLVFEARIEKLADILNKTQMFENLTDVYFKIYWMPPSQYRIEVMGLPKGFQEIRDDLTMLIKGKLDFVIPESFSARFKSYKMKSESKADGKLVKAIDETYTLPTPEIDLFFDGSGKLKTLETRSPGSAVVTEFYQSPKSWSNNKLVIDKIVSTTKQGKAITTITNALEYTTVEGIGFPSKISVKNVSEGIIPANGKNKEKKVRNETNTIIVFTTYEVNKGKARNFITEGLRK